MSPVPITPKVAHLRATLQEEPTFCSGTISLPRDQLEMYYGRHQHHFIDFSDAQEHPETVTELAAACKPAMFGRGDETVLDETYRKSRKMDASDFLMRFDLQESGLLGTVHAILLAGRQEEVSIRAELYKLNIYNEGEFFKAHADTPHSPEMFGSLVIVFPTPHEGGTLVLRDWEKEHVVDSGALLKDHPCTIAYAAFFSDVEHEVTPLLSGHRVTVTYNLFYAKPVFPTPAGLCSLAPAFTSVDMIAAALRALVDDPEFLCTGATLGFGLRHKYPLPKLWDLKDGGHDPLVTFLKGALTLKGSDHALFRAAETLGLKPVVRLVVREEGLGALDDGAFLLPRVPVFGKRWDEETTLPETLMESEFCAKELTNFGFQEGYWNDKYISRDNEGEQSVHWVTYTEAWNGTKALYMAYGNEASLQYMYGSLCLLIKIGKVDEATGTRGTPVYFD